MIRLLCSCEQRLTNAVRMQTKALGVKENSSNVREYQDTVKTLLLHRKHLKIIAALQHD